MRIIRCHIDNFGKISDMTLNFEEGMNVINEPNAWGKSTLAAFIKVMFYGLESRKETGAHDKERNLYRPWQGGTYGGELDFEVQGRRYRISRTFGKSEKFDEFHIYDLSTNLESVDFTEHVGEELFDLDGQSFKRSVYIAQSECAAQTTDAINAKLGNLAANTNDINNYETAQDTLKGLINAMSPTRATGSIRRRRNQLEEMKQELYGYGVAESSVAELLSKREECLIRKNTLMEKRDAYAAELTIASEESRRNEQRKTYLALCREQEQRLTTLLEISEDFPQGVPEDEEFREVVQTAKAMVENKTKVSHLKLSVEEDRELEHLGEMFQEKVPSDEEISAHLEQLESIRELTTEHTRLLTQIGEREKEWLHMDEEPVGRSIRFPAVGVVGAVMAPIGLLGEMIGATPILGLGILLETIYMVFCALVFVIGVGLILGAIKTKRNAIVGLQNEQREWEERKKLQKTAAEELKLQEEECNQRIWNETQNIRLFLEKYQVFCSGREFASKLYELKSDTRRYASLMEQQNRYRAADGDLQELRCNVESFGRRYGLEIGEDAVSCLADIQAKAAKYRAAREAVGDCKRRLADFEKDTNMEDLHQVSGSQYSLDEINQCINLLDEQVEEVRGILDQYNRQIDDLQVQLDMKEEREEEYMQCMALQEQETHKYEITVAAQEFLAKAKEQFTARYMAPITHAFQEYYGILNESGSSAQEAEKDWVIDANIAFHKKEHGELRDVHSMSAGFKDLVGICMRLALVKAMYQEEKPFLILDDPFVNLDEERTLCGMQLLGHVAEEYQTIYFTCHSSRKPQ